ncbi:MAG: hypothetical protein K8I82_06645 [Anaerolineae bacterium]|nr:hypothetical protein [Anaerolineae bacterium]
MLLERLRATTLDETLWTQALMTTQQGNYEEIRRLENAIKREKQAQDNIIASLGRLTHPEMVDRAQAQYEAAERRIEALKAEVAEVRSTRRREQTLLHARPALKRIAEHWDTVPSNERLNIFQEFARFVRITKLSRATKRIEILWKDGTTSHHDVIRESRGFFWDDEDIEKLKELIESRAPQAEILKAFPDCSWKILRDRYMYHFGKGRRFTEIYNVFGGKKRNERRYRVNDRWENTDEYKAEMAQSLEVAPSSDRY